jgi:hypothetical protein
MSEAERIQRIVARELDQIPSPYPGVRWNASSAARTAASETVSHTGRSPARSTRWSI